MEQGYEHEEKNTGNPYQESTGNPYGSGGDAYKTDSANADTQTDNPYRESTTENPYQESTTENSYQESTTKNPYQECTGNPYGSGRYSEMQGKSKNAGMGLISLILGVISLLFFYTGIHFIVAIVAIVFGIIQLCGGENKKTAIVGIVTAVLSMALFIGSIGIIVKNHAFVNMIKDEFLQQMEENGFLQMPDIDDEDAFPTKPDIDDEDAFPTKPDIDDEDAFPAHPDADDGGDVTIYLEPDNGFEML